MKSLSLIMGVAGLVVVLAGSALANDGASATPSVSTVKKDSGHAVSVPAAKETSPQHVLPPALKPNLPIDAGRKQGTANIGGPTDASGHKNGILNGTEIKRHP